MSWGWQRYPVNRLRPQLIPDGHGGVRPDFTTPDTAAVGSWLWAPATNPAEDLSSRRLGIKVAGALYGPAVVDVEAGDAVEFQVGRFRIVGEPQRWLPGTVLELERWDG